MPSVQRRDAKDIDSSRIFHHPCPIPHRISRHDQPRIAPVSSAPRVLTPTICSSNIYVELMVT